MDRRSIRFARFSSAICCCTFGTILLITGASDAARGSDLAYDWPKSQRRPASNASQELPAEPAPVTNGKSFTDVYKIALERAFTVNVQQEIIIQDNELDTQARAALLPSVTGSWVYQHQPSSDSSVGNSIQPNNQNTVKISADQPIFRGFRDFAALRQRKDFLNSAKFALQDAARTLYYNTAQAYYTVLALQSDEFSYKNEIAVNQKRLAELHGFVRIGRSQITDVLGQESTISGLEATVESTHGQLENAKEVLAYFTGVSRDTPISDNETPPAQPESVAFYLEKIEQRPDVKAAVASVPG
jgi:outer membrane protein TolC